jgi:hypothetical protein
MEASARFLGAAAGMQVYLLAAMDSDRLRAKPRLQQRPFGYLRPPPHAPGVRLTRDGASAAQRPSVGSVVVSFAAIRGRDGRVGMRRPSSRTVPTIGGCRYTQISKTCEPLAPRLETPGRGRGRDAAAAIRQIDGQPRRWTRSQRHSSRSPPRVSTWGPLTVANCHDDRAESGYERMTSPTRPGSNGPPPSPTCGRGGGRAPTRQRRA